MGRRAEAYSRKLRACRPCQILRGKLQLGTDTSAADNDFFQFLGGAVNAGHVLFLHAYRGAAAADVACDLIDIFYMDHFHAFLSYASGGSLEIQFPGYGYYKDVVFPVAANGHQGLVYFLVRQGQHVRYLQRIHKFVTFVGYVGVGDFQGFQDTHGIGFDFFLFRHFWFLSMIFTQSDIYSEWYLLKVIFIQNDIYSEVCRYRQTVPGLCLLCFQTARDAAVAVCFTAALLTGCLILQNSQNHPGAFHSR